MESLNRKRKGSTDLSGQQKKQATEKETVLLRRTTNYLLLEFHKRLTFLDKATCEIDHDVFPKNSILDWFVLDCPTKQSKKKKGGSKKSKKKAPKSFEEAWFNFVENNPMTTEVTIQNLENVIQEITTMLDLFKQQHPKFAADIDSILPAFTVLFDELKRSAPILQKMFDEPQLKSTFNTHRSSLESVDLQEPPLFISTSFNELVRCCIELIDYLKNNYEHLDDVSLRDAFEHCTHFF